MKDFKGSRLPFCCFLSLFLSCFLFIFYFLGFACNLAASFFLCFFSLETRTPAKNNNPTAIILSNDEDTKISRRAANGGCRAPLPSSVAYSPSMSSTPPAPPPPPAASSTSGPPTASTSAPSTSPAMSRSTWIPSTPGPCAASGSRMVPIRPPAAG